MREKELRLALVCYGGISLAVYMHGITKEIWHLVRASRARHDGSDAAGPASAAYARLLGLLDDAGQVRLRVFADIIAGASAGGINGIFLAQAVATGQSLEPLTNLWLECADVDRLVDPDARPLSKATKFWAVPIAWAAMKRRGNVIDKTVEAAGQDEVRAKLSQFVRARWFEPPFGGQVFSHMLLDAFDAMAASPCGPPLVPPGQPVDLMVTVTDFTGHPQSLALNSPRQVTETEHRLTLAFRHDGSAGARFADTQALAVAARATASFPGAFPPFTMREFDAVLRARQSAWAGRDEFLRAQLPESSDGSLPDDRVLIDGSVLANAPFRQAIAALKQRPARREVDRRFVYIDPKPDFRSISLGAPRLERSADGRPELPGFFTTILSALSEIPREQPIRDNVEAIGGMSARIRRMRHVIDAMRGEVDEQVEKLFGRTFFLNSPTAARLSAWRDKAQGEAAARAGFAYASYGHLKLSNIVEDMAATFARLLTLRDDAERQTLRQNLWYEVRKRGLDRISAARGGGASAAVAEFFRHHDLGFRIRRLRMLARQLDAAIEAKRQAPDPAVTAMHGVIFTGLGLYLQRQSDAMLLSGAPLPALASADALIDWMDASRGLVELDARVDAMLAGALAALPRDERRTMLLTYLGFPFYDIATLPLLQGEGQDEYDPIKVDRISPSDANAIRAGGAHETLKGVQFNSFGAFFSRAYRENDYLWGRLHGADRLIDIVASTLIGEHALTADALAAVKRAAFHAILDEEEARLPLVAALIAELRQEIG